jgi:hypothetical protein
MNNRKRSTSLVLPWAVFCRFGQIVVSCSFRASPFFFISRFIILCSQFNSAFVLSLLLWRNERRCLLQWTGFVVVLCLLFLFLLGWKVASNKNLDDLPGREWLWKRHGDIRTDVYWINRIKTNVFRNVIDSTRLLPESHSGISSSNARSTYLLFWCAVSLFWHQFLGKTLFHNGNMNQNVTNGFLIEYDVKVSSVKFPNS